MPLLHAHSFLVHPGKNDEEQEPIGGVTIPRRNRVFAMLSTLYDNADEECDIDIVFRPTNGRQENACRDLMLSYAADPNIENGRTIADRLQRVTTRRSGLGLFFLAIGSENAKLLMISRFPADQGVVAQELERRRLEVEFLERVFMKNARAYKSAIYAGPAVAGGLWQGRAVDKQINEQRELSNYWIGDFLDSELATTGPAGTKRLALAIRSAIKNAVDPELRDELIAATRLMRGHNGRTVSAQRLAANLGLTPNAVEIVRAQMPRPELFDEQFRFNSAEFDRHIMYRSIELNNGAILTAENARFEDVFQKRALNETDALYSTSGSVVNERLTKTP